MNAFYICPIKPCTLYTDVCLCICTNLEETLSHMVCTSLALWLPYFSCGNSSNLYNVYVIS